MLTYLQLASGIENDQHAFAAVSAATFMAAGTIVLFSLRRCGFLILYLVPWLNVYRSSTV
jgi:hypothetical protein